MGNQILLAKVNFYVSIALISIFGVIMTAAIVHSLSANDLFAEVATQNAIK